MAYRDFLGGLWGYEYATVRLASYAQQTFTVYGWVGQAFGIRPYDASLRVEVALKGAWGTDESLTAYQVGGWVGFGVDLAVGSRGVLAVGKAPTTARSITTSTPATNTGTARFVVKSAGDVLDTTRVSIPAGKFDYLLKNPSKWGVFSDSMGFNQAGLDSVSRSHLTGNFGLASPSLPMVGGGTKFTVRGPMTGPSGQTWDITTAWGVDPNGTIRLIMATP